MSTYNLDDEDAAYICGQLRNRNTPQSMDLVGRIEKQMPLPEPNHEYLIKDKDGDVWRWNARQLAWECVTHDSGAPGFCQWTTLVSQYSPVTLFAAIPQLMASRVFTAAHPGRCNECGEEIAPGDDVQYVDDELVHEDCNPELFGD